MSATLDTGLKGKLAVVTGSTKGIGYGIAKAFAFHGASVVVTGRSATEADAAKAKIVAATGANPSSIHAFAADLGTKGGVDSLIAQIDALSVPVDILVNNSGVYKFVGFFEESDEEWQKYHDVNVMSGVRLTRHYLKGMLERKWGRVLFSSSIAAAVPAPFAVGYSVSKLAQAGLARALAELTRGTEVTVNSVLIGPTESDGVDTFVADAAAKGVSKEDFVKTLLSSVSSFYALDNRLQTVDEVADVFVFLASKQGLLVNGTAQSASSGAVRHVL